MKPGKVVLTQDIVARVGQACREVQLHEGEEYDYYGAPNSWLVEIGLQGQLVSIPRAVVRIVSEPTEVDPRLTFNT
jgi:hypothetical protein